MTGSRMIGDRYRIEQTALIGEGGMGVVYKAFDTRLKAHVALKTLKGPVDHSSVELFEKEWTVLTRLRHPNIVSILDIGELTEEGQRKPYFVMPLLQGLTFDKLLRDSDLIPERVIEIIRQGCRGLQAAHDQGIIHRDIKPSNLFVMDDDTVQIIDFGVVHLVSTETNTAIKGSLPYMAPELLEMKPASAQSDIFAAGVLCYEALTGQRPFKGRTAEELVEEIRCHIPPPVSELNPAVNEQVSRTIHKALAKQPYHRFASIREFSDVLRRSFLNQHVFDTGKLKPRIERVRRALNEGDAQFALDILTELESEGNFDQEMSLLRIQAERGVRGKTIHQFLEIAQSRMEEGEYPLALQRIQGVLELDPQNVDALALKAEIESKRSTGQIDQWRRIARQHLDNRVFSRARQAVDEMLKLNPTDNTARSMLAEIKSGEEELSQLMREKQQLYDSALKAYGNGEISSALSRLEHVIELAKRAPGHPETEAQYLALYKQIRSERDELDRAYGEAKKALESHSYDKALEISKDVLRRRPRELLFQALELEIGEERRRNASSRVADFHRRIETEADLERKLALLNEAVREFSDEPSFVQLLKSAKQKLALVNSSVGRARQYESQGQFTEAANQWDVLRRIYPQYPGLDHEIQRLSRKQEQSAKQEARVSWLEKIDRTLEQGDYSGASSLVEAALGESPQDGEFLRRKQQVDQATQRSSQARDLLEQGQQFANGGNALKAIEKLRAARELDNRNQSIAAALSTNLVQHARVLADQDWRAAMPFAKEAVDVNPGDPAGKSVISFLESVRRHEEVERCLDECHTLQSQGRIDEALQRVDQTLRTFKTEPRLLQLKLSLRAAASEAPVRKPEPVAFSAAAAASGPATVPAAVLPPKRNDAWFDPFESLDARTATQQAKRADTPPPPALPPRIALRRVPADEPEHRFPNWKWFAAAAALLVFFVAGAVLLPVLSHKAKTQTPGHAPVSAQVQQPAPANNPQTLQPPPPSPAQSNPQQAAPQQTTPAVNPEPAPFQFKTNPDQADVVVDGDKNLACQSPCELKLTAGDHNIAVSAPGFPSVERNVTVPDDSGRLIDLTGGFGVVRVSTPAGATVSVDGEAKGKIPVTLHLLPGTHTIKIAGANLNCEGSFTVARGGFAFLSGCGHPQQTAARETVSKSTPLPVVASPQSQ